MGTERDCERALLFVMHMETNMFNNLIHHARKKQHGYQQEIIQTHKKLVAGQNSNFSKEELMQIGGEKRFTFLDLSLIPQLAKEQQQ